MAATIELNGTSFDMVSFFADWLASFTPSYGAFWSASSGITTAPSSTAVYDQWGNGATGGSGVVMSGDMQYSQGNLTGSVDTVALGSNYSESNASGFAVDAGLTITADPDYSLAGRGDLFDYAIYYLSQGSLTGIYNYLGAVGTEIVGTTGDDVLVGFSGADTFIFLGGHDTVTAGGTGTYGYQDGTDTLDVSIWGATAYSDLAVAASGSDTVISYGGNSVTLAGVSSSVIDASDFLFA
ncbi:Uncharacterised protein [Pannonibacter phragmitetus]|uniref:Calcium-binding protein n=1 Tax=Pannonibacter phragmitetus TaxID=121719 RepID=A0A378ZSC8_9HYPH|nr:hypothetical protein [Pannonibacter phragmitetus]SUA99690.1 Uncharacterised protein [Pannonibacter phragmitetus]